VQILRNRAAQHVARGLLCEAVRPSMITKPEPVLRRPRARSRERAPREGEPPELLSSVGRTVRALRMRKGYSLERLAKQARVSRAMLSQIELAQSAPTITLLWRIAAALDVPFSALLGAEAAPRARLVRAEHGVRLRSERGGMISRPLFPVGVRPRRTELYELELAPSASEPSAPHPAGTVENLVVVRGELRVLVGGDAFLLGAGDALEFQADVEHAYENASARPLTVHLAITYASEPL
jgi:transcriptional regulator with XRE-family HTH domain